MRKCHYCGKPKACRFEAKDANGNTVNCCSEECLQRSLHVIESAKKGRPLFYSGLSLALLLLLGAVAAQAASGSIFLQQMLMGVAFLLLGAVVVAFPMVSPEGIAAMGMRKLVLLNRVIGGLLALLGAVIIALKLFLGFVY